MTPSISMTYNYELSTLLVTVEVHGTRVHDKWTFSPKWTFPNKHLVHTALDYKALWASMAPPSLPRKVHQEENVIK